VPADLSALRRDPKLAGCLIVSRFCERLESADKGMGRFERAEW
jgi:hypothetical protein